MIIWTGTIGHTDIVRTDDTLPPGSAQPMSEAIEDAFERVTGHPPNITFSGWGQDYLPESYAAVIEGRDIRDDPTHYAAWQQSRQILEDLVLHDPLDIDNDRHRHALDALCELIWFTNKATS